MLYTSQKERSVKKWQAYRICKESRQASRKIAPSKYRERLSRLGPYDERQGRPLEDGGFVHGEDYASYYVCSTKLHKVKVRYTISLSWNSVLRISEFVRLPPLYDYPNPSRNLYNIML